MSDDLGTRAVDIFATSACHGAGFVFGAVVGGRGGNDLYSSMKKKVAGASKADQIRDIEEDLRLQELKEQQQQQHHHQHQQLPPPPPPPPQEHTTNKGSSFSSNLAQAKNIVHKASFGRSRKPAAAPAPTAPTTADQDPFNDAFGSSANPFGTPANPFGPATAAAPFHAAAPVSPYAAPPAAAPVQAPAPAKPYAAPPAAAAAMPMPMPMGALSVAPTPQDEVDTLVRALCALERDDGVRMSLLRQTWARQAGDREFAQVMNAVTYKWYQTQQ